MKSDKNKKNVTRNETRTVRELTQNELQKVAGGLGPEHAMRGSRISLSGFRLSGINGE